MKKDDALFLAIMIAFAAVGSALIMWW